MHNIFENAYFGKAYKTKLIKQNHFDYWNPYFISLSYNVENRGHEMFDTNCYLYHNLENSFNIQLRNIPKDFFDGNVYTYINTTVFMQIANEEFSDFTLQGCINKLITKTADIEKYYQSLKCTMASKTERIWLDRNTILRNNHYEDNVTSSNLYNEFLILQKHINFIDKIKELLKELSDEINTLTREMNEGQLIGFKNL